MPANKKQISTQIPREAIEGAVGINDEVNVVAIDMQQHFKAIETGEKPNKKNTKTIILNMVERPIFSTELTKGISIKAETTQKRNGQER